MFSSKEIETGIIVPKKDTGAVMVDAIPITISLITMIKEVMMTSILAGLTEMAKMMAQTTMTNEQVCHARPISRMSNAQVKEIEHSRNAEEPLDNIATAIVVGAGRIGLMNWAENLLEAYLHH